jgi:hypothetical protein
MAKTPKRPRDPNQLAKLVVDIAVGSAVDQPDTRDPQIVSMASKGGRARAEKLTADQRREIAQAAAAKRWEKD